ncbi:phosphodiesterase [Pseudomaricurvus alcaniphilus]|uniref:putative bifunctional diguanylate cyclase/phosphodiesterase n=1 Tax=Pseudomaricurvus alcaniphilus TaxID=1166482 RepID=UPI00140AAE72|nr:phosphodiesterase [Pseudomaricurvus alcaniphilus]NHN39755.1 phosphodiesterase [Pseudomaricurvus alcaniphilus]
MSALNVNTLSAELELSWTGAINTARAGHGLMQWKNCQSLRAANSTLQPSQPCDWLKVHNSGQAMSYQARQVLEQLHNQQTPGALCVLRVTELRLIAEAFGQRAGSELMGLVATQLRASMRQWDLLEQVSEDEFLLIVVGDSSAEDLCLAAQRLLGAASGAYEVQGLRSHIHASLGIARFPKDASEADSLLQYARISLYENRGGNNRNYHFFSPELLGQLQSQLWMLTELQDALAAERFELHYQPQFDVATQQIMGVEALVRLRTAAGEHIGPDKFIPLAEKHGLIVPIGSWVMRQACRQLKVLQQQGHGQLRMAVNVSPLQLLEDDFVAMVCAAVESAGIRYSDLELEITEGQVLQYLPLIETAFSELAAKGVRIAIDDFGTGFSALAYLTRMHWSCVKIDRAFLARVGDDPAAGRLVQAIIAMATELGLEVVAEGVEYEQQYRFLQNSGCQRAQGFGYSRPHTEADLPEQLQQRKLPVWPISI